MPVDLNAFLLRAELSVAWLHVWVQHCAAITAATRTTTAVDTTDTAAGAAYRKAMQEATAWLAVDERALLSRGEIPASASQASEGQSKSAEAAAAASHAPSALPWLAAAQRRQEAMTSLLWQPKEGRWLDALVYEGGGNSISSTRSSGDGNPQCKPVPIGSAEDATPLSGWAAPLWAGLGRGLNASTQSAIVANLTASGLLQEGGALTTRHGGGSNCTSNGTCGQQW